MEAILRQAIIRTAARSYRAGYRYSAAVFCDPISPGLVIILSVAPRDYFGYLQNGFLLRLYRQKRAGLQRQAE